jgi:geranylgeranyl pyrophosphate synthase
MRCAPGDSATARRTLERFPPSPARQAMLDLADFCVERAY